MAADTRYGMIEPIVYEGVLVSKSTVEWIKNVVEGLDEHADPKTCERVLEACGRRCAPESLVNKAREIYRSSSDIGEFIVRLSEVFDAVQIEDDRVYVVYPECYCEHIKGVPIEEIPNSYCQCSVGWVKEIFETALGRPVQVKRIASVVAGDSECRFEVNL